MKLFKKLASIYSGSGEERQISAFIVRWVRNAINKKELSIVKDKAGNIYITRGNAESYPCVVAHLDQVQDRYPSDYMVLETSEHFMGFSPSTRSYCGLGGDDKCGIWIALKMLLKHEVLKVAFFVEEEVGCVGSSQADITFFSDCRFVIEPDRRGAGDLITSIGGGNICSKSFLDNIDYKDYGYKPTMGLMTDVLALHELGVGLSCINLSCGYYKPHTDEEYVVKCDMENAKDFVDHIISKCVETYPHEYVRQFYAHNSRHNSYFVDRSYYDDYGYYDTNDRAVDTNKRGFAGVSYGTPKKATTPYKPDADVIDSEINQLYDYLENDTDALEDYDAASVHSLLGFRELNVSDVRSIMEDVILNNYSEEEANAIFEKRWNAGRR